MTKKEKNVITPQEKEELLLRFFHSFLTNLIYICKIGKCEMKYFNKEQLEHSITNSLILMSQLHTANSAVNMYYRRVDYEDDHNLFFNVAPSNQVVVLKLRELKVVIKDFPFIETSKKQFCLSLIEQIQCYYNQDEFVIVDPNLHADPWLATSTDPEYE